MPYTLDNVEIHWLFKTKFLTYIYMRLSHKVVITIPSTMGLDIPIDNTEYVNRVANKLAILFGGSRIVSNIKGYYIADNGTQVIEDNIDIIAFFDTLDDDTIEKIVKIALDVKNNMRQESILYQIDDIAYIE